MKIEKLNKSFGETPLYRDFSLSLPKGQISCLLGPSGCGKTSLLNMIARLLPYESGIIEAPDRVSYVFQEPRLLPWMTITNNLIYSQDRHLSHQERKERSREMINKVGLEDSRHKFPGELSGGMARRVGLARALLARYDLMLMDEPLASLDQKLKENLILLIKEELKGKTALLVTHDYYTARMLSDRIFLLSLPPVKAEEIYEPDLQNILQEINSREKPKA